MKKIIVLCMAVLVVNLVSPVVMAEADRQSEHAKKTLEIYTRIVEVESSKNLGNVPEIANYLAGELLAAGFPEEDVEVVPLGETASLIAKYRGEGSSAKAPILLLGHHPELRSNGFLVNDCSTDILLTIYPDNV